MLPRTNTTGRDNDRTGGNIDALATNTDGYASKLMSPNIQGKQTALGNKRLRTDDAKPRQLCKHSFGCVSGG